MKYTIVLVATLLVGCVDPTEINTAKSKYLCRYDGGLHKIQMFSEYPVVCSNGKVFSVNDLETVIISDPEYYAESM